MRSALLAVLVLSLAAPAAAQGVLAPEPLVTAYSTAPVAYSEPLSVSPTNPSLVIAPGGRFISARGVLLASEDPGVFAWLHDFETGRTERVDLAGASLTWVIGISTDGDVLLLSDELGTPHLRQRSSGATVQLLPPGDPEQTTLVAGALSADGQTVWMQWARSITDPDQLSSGWATFHQSGAFGEGAVIIRDERQPLAASPSLNWYVRATGSGVELVGPGVVTPLPGLGPAVELGRVEVTDPGGDGTVEIAFVSTATTLPGAGVDRCGGEPCAEMYRTSVTAGVPGPVELVSVADDGTRIDEHVADIALSPSGELAAFSTTTALVANLTSGEVPNVYVAGTQHLRAVSALEISEMPADGGRFPRFLNGNELLFYADLHGLPTIILGEFPVPGLRAAQIQPFDDMATTVHEGAIWWAVDRGVTQGCTQDRFCPRHPLTRAQMAALLARTLGLNGIANGPFIDATGAHAGAVNAIAAAGLTQGCEPDLFCPDRPVTRAQIATFLSRARDLVPLADGPFTDATGTHAGAINAIAAAGISEGCGGARFCPEDHLTRDQTMTFLFRAFGP